MHANLTNDQLQPLGDTPERAYFQQFAGDELMEHEGEIYQYQQAQNGKLLLSKPADIIGDFIAKLYAKAFEVDGDR